MTHPGGLPTDGPATGDWRPANEAELRMLQALLRGDTAEYFRTVVASPLYVGGRSADPAAGRPQSLVVWDLEGPHLPAFTSPAGLARCLGGEADTILEFSYADLARQWPDPSWRLALNPTLPIDAVLPVEAVGAAARGDAVVPLATGGPPGVVPPELRSPADRARAAAGKAPSLDDFRASEPVEAALAYALSERDVGTAVDALLTASVLLPTRYPVENAEGLGEPDFPWFLAGGDQGSPGTIMVFTSTERLVDAVGATQVSTVWVDLIEVLLGWPDPECRLVVNPGSAIEISFSGAQLPGLLRWAEAKIALLERDGPEGERG